MNARRRPADATLEAVGAAIGRLARGEAPPPVHGELPLDRELWIGHLARLRLDTPRLVAAVEAQVPEGGVLGFLAATERGLQGNAALARFLAAACAAVQAGQVQAVPPPERDDDPAVTVHDVVHYAFALDALTRAMAEEPTGALLDEAQGCIEAATAGWDLHAHMNRFEWFKLNSLPSLRRWAALSHGRRANPRVMKWLIAANILEAAGEDRRLGYHDNAHAAVALAERPFALLEVELPDGRRDNVDAHGRQHEAPVEPELWNDLFISWDAAFVSHYAAGPWFYPKLVMPSVGNHRGAPDLFMYHRAVSLYLHAWFTFASRVQGTRETRVDWRDDGLTRLWSQVNRACAADYRQQVGDPPELRRFRRQVALAWAAVRLVVRKG